MKNILRRLCIYAWNNHVFVSASTRKRSFQDMVTLIVDFEENEAR